MPVILLERIPLPSLKAYTGFSVVLLACALFYAHQVVLNAETHGLEIPVTNENPETDVTVEYNNVSLPYDTYIENMLYVMTTEAWCVWTLVNTAYCCMILLGKMVQKVVFGELRVSEKQHLKDNFWNFLFYKFIFVFGVMNVQTMEEVVLWVAWFTVLGFFHLLTKLSKDRFEYVSFSPTTPRVVHVKLLSLLFVIILACVGLMVVCALVGMHLGLTIFAFMGTECILLMIRTMHVVVRYFLHLFDINLEGVWENRATYVYYTELIFELLALSIDFAHHLHMLLWGNIFLSMASLVICMQLRYLFYECQRRIKRHKNYKKVVKNMEERFAMATSEELSNNDDNCAVCWEKMESARKLPCGHLFHHSCLLSWLEQDTSCPTCRQTLSDRPETDPNVNEQNPRIHGDIPPPPNPPPNQTTNHFFHFDASRYVSWLPSFSVEVTHTNILPNNTRLTAAQTSQLDNMARQVLQVFPHMPLNVVMDDLRATRSVDFTIENILEGRLQAPPRMINDLAEHLQLIDTDSLLGHLSSAITIMSMRYIDFTRENMLEGRLQAPPPGSLLTRTALLDEDQDDDVDDDLSSDDSLNQIVPDMLTDIQLPTERGDNIEERREDLPSQFGGRFSKSANERESMLQDRKNSMLEQARRRYLNKQSTSSTSDRETQPSTSFTSPFTSPLFTNIPSSHTSTESESQLRRRELAYKAATRRLEQNPET